MHLRYNLRNLPLQHRYGTQDVVDEIRAGMEDCGHTVGVDDQDFMAAPAVNLIFEHFKPETIDSLREFKAQAGDNLILGILSGEDLNDPLIMPREFQWRRDAYLRAIELAHFVWTIVQNVVDYAKFADASKVFWFELGYSERLQTVLVLGTRETAVFMPGHVYPYRAIN